MSHLVLEDSSRTEVLLTGSASTTQQLIPSECKVHIPMGAATIHSHIGTSERSQRAPYFYFKLCLSLIEEISPLS